MNEIGVKNYKDYVITTEEGTEKGIFFRSPIQLVEFDIYAQRFNAREYLKNMKNPLFVLFEHIKGNSSVINNIKEWSENDNWAGFTASILCFPVYFTRNYRKLKAYSASNETNIQDITSYGFENAYNGCKGGCKLEKTTIVLKNGKRQKLRKTDNYCYTYEFKVREIIDSGV